MDFQPDSEPELTGISATNNADCAAYAASGAFFPQATGFNICGGMFTSNVTNNVYNSPPEQPSAFRTILLGDINLIKEFKEMRSSPESSLVGRQTLGTSVRRVYTAKLEGRQSGHMTVAIYEGDGAEEAWKQHLAKYEAIRHPNIMQLYGLMSTRRLRGMVFHDELIPCAQFLYRFEHSPILSTYIIGYCITEFSEAKDYIQNLSFPTYNLSVWIRSATGKLCVDLVQGGTGTRSELWWNADVRRLENISLDAPNSEDIIISSLSEDQYHKLCSQPSMARSHCFQVSTRHPVGTQIFRSDSQDGTWVRITEPLILPEEELHWNDYGGELLPNSWIRYNSHRIPELHIRLSSRSYKIQRAWLAQANHIFAQLEEEAHVEDYVCVDHVRFMLRIADERHIPEGYLFVCPAQDFFARNEAHAKLYQWPACPAYWSLDPSGTDRLSMKAAKILGFPPIHFETSMFGSSWDHSVYKGLRRFHEGKGLDPESREVARGLGYPLYEVLSNLGSEVPFPCRDVGQFYCEVKDPALCREFGHYL